MKGKCMMSNSSDMRKGNSGERGQAMVEFALIAPLLLIIVLGIIQFGIAYNHYLTLTDAVRAGSRQAAVSRALPDPTGTAVARVKSAASGSLNVTNMVIDVKYNDPLSGSTVPTQGGDVTVTATYPYAINLLGVVVKTGTLTSKTTERVE
jgi:Flp pilus assembly protein TadG